MTKQHRVGVRTTAGVPLPVAFNESRARFRAQSTRHRPERPDSSEGKLCKNKPKEFALNKAIMLPSEPDAGGPGMQ